jgi:hypothetical protein
MSRVGVTNRTPARTSETIELNVLNLAKEWKKVNIKLKKNMKIKENMENTFRKVVTSTNLTNMTPKQQQKWRKWLNDFEKRIKRFEKEINKMKKQRNEINNKGKISAKRSKISTNSLKKIANNLNIK